MKTILLVDDTQELRDLMEFHLSGKGFKVVTAANGLEALRVFKAIPEIQAVVTDMEMPMMNGIQLVDEIRKIDADIPIVMWSGAINPGIKGLDLFLQKESGPKAVVAFLNATLKEVA